MFLGLPDPDTLVRGADPDPTGKNRQADRLENYIKFRFGGTSELFTLVVDVEFLFLPTGSKITYFQYLNRKKFIKFTPLNNRLTFCIYI
jgi:hypothetical protein